MLPTFTAFAGQTCIAAGSLRDVATAVAAQPSDARPSLIFDDTTGEQVDLDLRAGPDGAVAEFLSRGATLDQTPPRGRGRPRLGVVAREVTLLPRHWDWLAAQPGGASAALRRLVDSARRDAEGPDRARQARDATYKVMSALTGDLPGYEEAIRALFAGDVPKLMKAIASWPPDIASYVGRLASAESAAPAP